MAIDTTSKQSRTREALVDKYAYLVDYVVGRVLAGLPAHMEKDDLVSAGLLGLLHAVNKFDASRNVRFETYAVSCIRGAVLEFLRSQDWLPRSLRSKARAVYKAEEAVSARLGRPAAPEEIAKELQISLAEYDALLSQLSHLTLVSTEEFLFEGDETQVNSLLKDEDARVQPEQQAERSNLRELLAKAIEQLPYRERTLLALYYYEGLTLREIGNLFEVSESRACQLHTQALLRLKRLLQATGVAAELQ
jgi:RNA polymerase sigma factor for flagellar operon FliA